MVFSLGSTFQLVPLDQAIALDVLLQPLQPDREKGVGRWSNLLTSNHPPLCFVLALVDAVGFRSLTPPTTGMGLCFGMGGDRFPVGLTSSCLRPLTACLPIGGG